MSTIREALTRNIKKVINDSNMPKKDISARLGITPAAVSNWLSGKNVPDVETLIRFCDLFHLTLNEVYADGEEIDPYDPIKSKVDAMYEKMNDGARVKLYEYATDLMDTGKYLRNTEKSGLPTDEN